jgi:hypothetical protein
MAQFHFKRFVKFAEGGKARTAADWPARFNHPHFNGTPSGQ